MPGRNLSSGGRGLAPGQFLFKSLKGAEAKQGKDGLFRVTENLFKSRLRALVASPRASCLHEKVRAVLLTSSVKALCRLLY